MENIPNNIHTMPPSPNSKSHTLLWIILSIILTAVLIGGGLFLYNQQADSRTARLQSEKEKIATEQKLAMMTELATLQEQIARLGEDYSRITTQEQIPMVTFDDTRQLLDGQTAIQEIQDDPLYRNIQIPVYEPNTYVLYSDLIKGFQVRLPYNPAWGGDKFRINPYEPRAVEQDGKYVLLITFGPLTNVEGGLGRPYNIVETEPVSAAQLVEMYTTNPELYGERVVNPPTIKNISGLEVVEYTSSGLCDSVMATVIGETNNYTFTGLCVQDGTMWEKIIESFKFL